MFLHTSKSSMCALKASAFHSARSALIGSTLIALLAGISHAIAATTISTAAAAIIGSACGVESPGTSALAQRVSP